MFSFDPCSFFFFFNDTATTEIYTLSLHDALPIFDIKDVAGFQGWYFGALAGPLFGGHRYHDYFYTIAPQFATPDRKSTRLNSSHPVNSYAVLCFKKKKTPTTSSSFPSTDIPTSHR